MATRRQIILGAGAGVALVGVGATWRVMRMPTTAVAPWRELATPVADVRLDALRHAILAPNPHNRQPWLLRLEGDDAVLVSCDPDKRLPETDPFDRQITIGFGTFIETARIAASARGQRLIVEPFPAGVPAGERDGRLDTRPLARLRFAAAPGLARDPLFPAIPLRRSTKTEYDLARPVTAGQLRALTAPQAGVGIGATADPVRLAPLRAAIVDGVRIETLLPRTMQESIDVLRIGAAEADATPDGLSIGGPMVEALAATGQLNRATLADPSSFAFRTGLDQQLAVQGSIPALIWVTTPGNGRLDQLAAGYAWARINLLATALGLAVHPASQTLQEYPEMAARFAEVHRLLGVAAPGRVQMLCRLGFGPSVPPAPRWPLDRHIVT